jgi:hypothetical protein
MQQSASAHLPDAHTIVERWGLGTWPAAQLPYDVAHVASVVVGSNVVVGDGIVVVACGVLLGAAPFSVFGVGACVGVGADVGAGMQQSASEHLPDAQTIVERLGLVTWPAAQLPSDVAHVASVVVGSSVVVTTGVASALGEVVAASSSLASRREICSVTFASSRGLSEMADVKAASNSETMVVLTTVSGTMATNCKTPTILATGHHSHKSTSLSPFVSMQDQSSAMSNWSMGGFIEGPAAMNSAAFNK